MKYLATLDLNSTVPYNHGLVDISDDGYIGDKNWNPLQEDTAWIRIKWWVRNPFHNLVFYVLGCAHKESERYSTANSGVFKEDGGWMFAFSKTKYFVYPFVSYLGKIKFYIGWRERGNFGLKLTANSGWNNGK